MPTILMGDQKYTEQYVIEYDRDLFGPFESKSDAVEFAMLHLELPWGLWALNTLQREDS